MQKSVFGVAALTVVVGSLTAWNAFAASPHVKGGRNAAGVITADQGKTLEACITLSGLGGGDLYATVIAQGVPVTTCTSPGGNEAPGQNPATGTYSGTDITPSSEIKNGTVTVCANTDTPPNPSGIEGGCPNNNWSATITDVKFTGGTLVVRQGSATGPIVYEGAF